jgi:transcriptional regulator with XRE-family HTH domain
MMRPGEVIRERRLALKLSERELARLAKVAQSDLSRVERGEIRPSPALAAKVCEVLGIRLPEVFADDHGAADDDAPAEDMVQQLRAILIRGHWPPLAREGLINLARATQPAQSPRRDDELGFVNAKKLILQGVS